jgi:hypothetical protein
LYNEARSHQGRWCFGKTPMQTFLDALPMTKEKMIRKKRIQRRHAGMGSAPPRAARNPVLRWWPPSPQSDAAE